MSDFKFNIVKSYGVLSSNNGYSKEVNLVSFNDREPTVDIRNWYTDPETGEKKMMKGITLKAEEVNKLKEVLSSF